MGRCIAAVTIYNHLYYLRNADKGKARVAAWRVNNPERARSHSLDRSDYFSRPDVKEKMLARSRLWAVSNREKVRAAANKYRQSNLALYACAASKRHTRKLQATPAWLTQEHWDAIRAVYAESERLTRETGIKYEVDHIVPLRGKTVCGLHVPWNLRAIPMIQNRCRPRTWRGAIEDDPRLVERAF